MIPLIIVIVLIVITFAFCEPSKRWGLFLPLIWVVVFFSTLDYYADNNVIIWIALLIGLLSVLFFVLCVVESFIRIFKPGFDFVQNYKDKKLAEELKATGHYPGN